jgi:hypothetical protein
MRPGGYFDRTLPGKPAGNASTTRNSEPSAKISRAGIATVHDLVMGGDNKPSD